MMQVIINILYWSFIIYYVALSLWYTILVVLCFPEVIRKFNEVTYGNAHNFIDDRGLAAITTITPVFNEKDNLLDTVYSILNSTYKNIELILVNDGSTDDTMEILKKELLLEEIPIIIEQIVPTAKIKHCYQSKRFTNITVIDKEHGQYNCGADSLNAGLNACKTPLMLTIDADTVLEPEAITRVLFSTLSASHCIVASGSLYVLNDNKLEKGRLLTHKLPRHFISAVQGVEYFRSFLYGRAGLNVLGGALCFPGAFSMFSTKVLYEAGGFDTPNFGYDAEITTRIQHIILKNKLSRKLIHSPSAFGWTDVPTTLKSFWKQRNYWQRGMLRTMTRHMDMFFNPKYKVVGLITFPAFVLFEVFGPVIECFSIIFLLVFLGIGELNLEYIWLFLFLAWGFIGFLSVAILFLNQITFNKYKGKGEFIKVLFLITAEMCGFRQYRALCCTVGTFQYAWNRFRGKPL